MHARNDQAIERPHANGDELTTSSLSREIAQGKLEQLLSPSFTRYALRFMNFAEYDHLLQGRLAPRGEAWVSWEGEAQQCSSGEPVPFCEYVNPDVDSCLSHGWLDKIRNQTEWSYSNDDLETSLYLRMFLTQAHRAAVADGHVDLRARTMKAFADLVIKEAEENFWLSDGILRPFSFVLREGATPFERCRVIDDPQLNRETIANLKRLALDEYDRISANGPEQRSSHTDCLKQFLAERPGVDSEKASYVFENFLKAQALIGFDAIDRVTEFLASPESFTRAAVAELIELASFSPKWPEALGRRVNCAPYHLMVVFSGNSVRQDRPHQWQEFIDIGPDSVLGAVSILPNGKLLHAMCNASRSASGFAHPVFDMYGKSKFPG
jgi:hypothetical protein